jgi:hypothetical protein
MVGWTTIPAGTVTFTVVLAEMDGLLGADELAVRM